MKRLKADLHAHCGDDPRDLISYSAEMLIESAAQLNFDVLAIACHEALVYSTRLAEYAVRRGILLVPAIELLVEGKHVVVLNPDAEQARAGTFAELRALGRRDAVIVAAHPYFYKRCCLGKRLVENIDVFDAIEYSSFYCRTLNPNRKAVKLAQKHRLPLIGTSDAHTLPYSDSTFTWVEAQATVEGIVEAVREGRVEVDTGPRSLEHVARMVYFSAREAVRDVIDSMD